MTDTQHNLKITYRDDTLEVGLPLDSSIADLASHCADRIGAEVSNVTLFFMPKPGLLKSPFPDTKLSDILSERTRIKLVGSPSKEVQHIEKQSAKLQALTTARNNVRKATPSRHRDWNKAREEAMYTFHAIEPLPYLPNPEKSRRYLERLAKDPGIKAAMRKHKFSVGLLTEMNPAEHTTHESKTLGLNRNKGEVIELRLRTDRYDGYRDYKVIRKTLCHELSHNVHGDHDRKFWNLTSDLEHEVQKNDYLHGGHKLTEQEFYDPADTGENVEFDHGGWVGGEFVLGRSESTDTSADAGLSRSEIMARAALSRQEKQKKVQEQEQAKNQVKNQVQEHEHVTKEETSQ